MLALLSLLYAPIAIACGACPSGKECYFVDVWLTEEELEKEASSYDACGPSGPRGFGVCTGLGLRYRCENGKTVVTQISPDRQMRVRGDEPQVEVAQRQTPSASTLKLLEEIREPRAQCGSGKSVCLRAHDKLQHVFVEIPEPDESE